MEEYYVNLDEINTLKDSFNVIKSKYSNNNKEYYHLNYNNKTFFINFKGIIYNIELIPRKKIFIKVDEDVYNNYMELLSKVSNNIGITIEGYDSTYLNDNHYLLAFITGFKSNNNNIIYTNLKILNGDDFEEIKIIDDKLLHGDDIFESFECIITLKVKNICKDSFKKVTYKLFNDIHQIVITKNIIKKEKKNNVDNILKLIDK